MQNSYAERREGESEGEKVKKNLGKEWIYSPQFEPLANSCCNFNFSPISFK